MTKNEDLEYFLDLAIKHEHKDVCVATVSHERYLLDLMNIVNLN